MSKPRKRITQTDIPLIVGAWLLMIILSPIIIPVLIYAFVKNKYEAAKLSRFLARNEGARFFCYTTKRTGLAFVREKILPRLDPDIQIIYMSQRGRENLGDNSEINTLIGMQAGGARRGGYPCIAKMEKGELISESLNTEFYRTIVRKAEPENLLRRIYDFYNSTDQSLR